jgi:hypothetical protein
VQEEPGPYGVWIALLALVSMLCVIGMFWGELTNHRLWTGGFIGVVLIAYSFILLLLRKGGLTGV